MNSINLAGRIEQLNRGLISETEFLFSMQIPFVDVSLLIRFNELEWPEVPDGFTLDSFNTWKHSVHSSLVRIVLGSATGIDSPHDSSDT